MSILIVEDDGPLRETFEDVLRQMGYRVTSASNGRDALERIRADRPSFIFIDLILPGMSGAELIEALRGDSELSSIPFVAMTASTATPPSGVLFMRKPFSAEIAIALIEAHNITARHRTAI